MKKTNKIISAISALTMITSMFGAFATVANAEVPAVGTPKVVLSLEQDGSKVDDEVKIDVSYEGNNAGIFMLQYEIGLNSEYFEYVSTKPEDGYEEMSKGSTAVKFVQTWKTSQPTNASAKVGQLVLKVIKDLPDTGVVVSPSKAKLQICDVSNTGDYVKYFTEDVNGYDSTLVANKKLEVASVTVNAPKPIITVTSSAATVEKGSSIDVTATAANFETAPTEFNWTVEGKTSKDTKVEGNGAKATLTVGQDETASKLTVVATSGDVSGSAVVNVVDKKYPLEINADTFKDDETTITITPGSDYVADTEYTVTVQFFAADGTASAWVTQSGLKNNAALTVGAQGAAKANVKAVTADGTIIGSMQQVK